MQYFGKTGTLISSSLSGFVYFNECNVIPPSKVLIVWGLDSQRCWQLSTPMFLTLPFAIECMNQSGM